MILQDFDLELLSFFFPSHSFGGDVQLFRSLNLGDRIKIGDHMKNFGLEIARAYFKLAQVPGFMLILANICP